MIWDWALKVYDQPGAPEITLRLQDDFGQNTAFLLWAAWAGVTDPPTLAQAADLARSWEAGVLGPLRQVRRTLKPVFPGVEDAPRSALREAVKAAELNAERLLMDSLARLGPPASHRAALPALTAAAAVWGGGPPEADLAALAQALRGVAFTD